MTKAKKSPEALAGAHGAAIDDLGGSIDGKEATAATLSRQQKWRKRNPRAYLAHRAVQMALELGVLEKQPCSVCGDPKSEAHHPRYDRPFDVIWLCRPHHRAIHRTEGAGNE